MKIHLDKTYKLRPRSGEDVRWFLFTPVCWIPNQQAWRGKSASSHDLILFERELGEFDVIEVDAEHKPKCDCGAHKARTTHAQWCSQTVGAQAS